MPSNLSILGVDWDPSEFYMMFLSRELDINLCQIETKIYIYKILYKNRRFKQVKFSKYTTNLEKNISQRSLKNLGFLLSSFEFDNFSSLTEIIGNIIESSVSREQNSDQWQCSVVVTCLRLYHMIQSL